MALMGAEEQDDALAESVKGELTLEPLPGEFTVGFAKAGAARTAMEAKNVEVRASFRRICI